MNVRQRCASIDIERLGALRLCPYERTADPKSVPCNETSDASKLCLEPLVSVVMLTYNHGDSIRSAIEGVMMQKTDFPFELVIGEDASTDCTRQICFEMQRRYPERIRVLWSEENVYSMGGSGLRVTVRCRGAYRAFCEGDDVWIDPFKLQKQIDLMRRHPEVGICLGGTEVEHLEAGGGGGLESFPYAGRQPMTVPGDRLVRAYLDDVAIDGIRFNSKIFQTSGILVRVSALEEAKRRFPDVYSYRWGFGDIVLSTTVAAVSSVCFLFEPVSRYRMTGRGATATRGARLLLNGVLFAVYLRACFDGICGDDVIAFEARRLRRQLGRVLAEMKPEEQRIVAGGLSSSSDFMRLFDRSGYRKALRLLALGALTPARWERIQRIGRMLEGIYGIIRRNT